MAEHDSDAWETFSGWIWSCRTCLAKGLVDTGAEARAQQAAHDARPVPWWALRLSTPANPEGSTE